VSGPTLQLLGGPDDGLALHYRGPHHGRAGYGLPVLARHRDGTAISGRWIARWCAPGTSHGDCGAQACPGRKAAR
jgi:hypothetical protein